MNYTIKSEEYLLSISNKGILSRSIKDLENLTIDYVVNDDFIELNFSDNTIILKENLNDCSCTCPSSSICKHIVTSYLFLNKELGSDEQLSFDDEEIKNINYKKIFKDLGTTYQKEFLQNIATNNIPKCTKTSIITISPLTNVTVKILNPLDLSTCTCMSKSLCKHKLLAFLYYLVDIGVVDKTMFEVSKKDQNNFIESQKYCLQINKMLTDCFKIGLSRTSETIVEKLERAALYSRVLELADLSNMLRDLSGNFNAYFTQDVFFEETTLLNKIVNVYKLTNNIISANNYTEFSKYAGVFKSEYSLIPSLNLTCISVRDISTKSGYVGKCLYLLDEQSSEVYSFTSVNPTYLNNHIPVTLSVPWSLNVEFDSLIQKKLSIRYPKISVDCRISSSKDTHARVTTTIKENPISNDCINYDYSKLVTMEDLMDNQRIKLISVTKLQSNYFSNIKQSYVINIFDENNFKITCELKKSSDNEVLYNNIIDLLNDNKQLILIGSLYQRSNLTLYVTNYIEVEK